MRGFLLHRNLVEFRLPLFQLRLELVDLVWELLARVSAAFFVLVPPMGGVGGALFFGAQGAQFLGAKWGEKVLLGLLFLWSFPTLGLDTNASESGEAAIFSNFERRSSPSFFFGFFGSSNSSNSQLIRFKRCGREYSEVRSPGLKRRQGIPLTSVFSHMPSFGGHFAGSLCSRV